jgi:50S ribosome-binding GTPase
MSVRPSRLGRGRDDRLAVDHLVDRVDALRRFVDLTAPHLPPSRLDPARRVVGRAGERLALSRAHTVVALAGATGSGKSSIFNALAGQEFSAVGLRRPTTGAAHACVWGPDSAHELLDWLGIERRYSRTNSNGLTGLVLVDLPDLDSVEASHHVEADRLLSLADLIVWVLDPQKYADKLIHRQYLAAFGHHRDITVVTLHQADRLGAAGIQACLGDLRRLLESDGLGGVPTMPTSTVGDPGLGALQVVLEQTVAARIAALQRLSADVTASAADLAPLVEAPRTKTQEKDIAADLDSALGSAAGVPLVAQATERSYVHRAVRHVGWPVTRWVRRFRADPLGRLRLGRQGPANPDQPVAATSIGPAAPAAQAAVGLALRSVGDRYSAGLPEPWPDAMLAAARSRSADIPDALDVAIARTDLGMSRIPVWWRVVGLLQWLFVFCAVVGLIWLVLRYFLFALALPEPPAPQVGRVPLFTALFVGGLVAGLLLALVVRPIVSLVARRRRRRVTARLTEAVRQVGDDLVLAPVREVCRTYGEARAALRAASP